MFSKGRLGTSLFVAMSLGLSGCATSDPEYEEKNNQAKAAIAKIRESPFPAGYEVVGGSEGTYSWYLGEVIRIADVSIQIQKSSSSSIGDECKEIINYFFAIGLTKSTPTQDNTSSPNRTEYQLNCVVSSQVYFFGSTSVDGVKTRIEASFSRLGSKSFVTIATKLGWGDDPEGLPYATGDFRSDLVRGAESALERIAKYRANHPDEEPYAEASVRAALKDFKTEHPTLTLSIEPNAQGLVTRIGLEITDVDEMGLCPIAMSIKVFDTEHFGIEDPGIGYKFSYADGGVLEFGQGITKCKILNN